MDVIVTKDNEVLFINFFCEIDCSNKLGVTLQQLGIESYYPFVHDLETVSESSVFTSKTGASQEKLVSGITARIRPDQRRMFFDCRSTDMVCDFLLNKAKKKILYANM